MKKNFKFLLISLIISLGISSCKKDNDTTKNAKKNLTNRLEISAGGKIYLVSKISGTEGNYLEALYETGGRLSKTSSFVDERLTGETAFFYNGDTVIIDHVVNAVKQWGTVLIRGVNEYAKQSIRTDFFKNGNYTDTTRTTTVYIHNSEGYIINTSATTVQTSENPDYVKKKHSTVKDFAYSNGNLVHVVETTDKRVRTTEYEYYTGKPYVPLLFDATFEFLLGERSKNLIKRIAILDLMNGQPVNYTFNFAYIFDGDGLPVSATQNNEDRTIIEYIAK